MPAGPVAADHHLAAAGAAGGVDPRAGDADVLAGHLDGAALGVLLLAGGRKRSGELHGLLGRARALAGAGGGADHNHAVAPMVPVLRTPGATSAAKPPLVAVMLP